MLSLPVLTGTDLDAITLPTKTITAITRDTRVIIAHTDMPGIIMDRMPPAGIATGLTVMAGIIMADKARKKRGYIN
ncbi:MAG: hypothetical protein A4E66_00856 [Syntrophus sp. PtaB.Bin001]|nr:MAG: hypothetical protein A4E66_00856 [Syntrophus sp. PtaB.Bin001]